MKLSTHLFIEQCTLAPGAEWNESLPGWKIVLVDEGISYWMWRGEVQELQRGDVLVIGPVAEGFLRASQIAGCRIHFFSFQPDHLFGLMSLSERLSLDAFGNATGTRVISCAKDIAKEYHEIVRTISFRRNFFSRCRLLHLVAMIFGERLPSPLVAKNHLSPTLTRFEAIISRIPEVDLIDYSTDKLAEICGCSLRHFRRMFRKHFKTSVRAKQTELRLAKAKQLLAETNDKIAAIASACRFRHMGLFNSTFKAHCGMTPTEWRSLNRHEKTPLAHAV